MVKLVLVSSQDVRGTMSSVVHAEPHRHVLSLGTRRILLPPFLTDMHPAFRPAMSKDTTLDEVTNFIHR